MDRVADAHAAAVVHRHPRRAGDGVEKGVEDRPVGDRIRAVAHGLRLTIRRCDGAGVEVVPSDHDRRLHLPLGDEAVEQQTRLGPLAVAEPADARRQSLERDALLRHADPAM